MDNKIKAYNAWFAKGKEEGIKEEKQRIKNEFDKLWCCLKFEKCESKVIGYTFLKKDIEKFKEDLK